MFIYESEGKCSTNYKINMNGLLHNSRTIFNKVMHMKQNEFSSVIFVF